jgi:YidC/Oxa1 family membrane protein insertase
MFKDKNTTIGFVLLGLLFFGYFGYISIQQKKMAATKNIEKAKQDSIDKSKAPKPDTIQLARKIQDSIINQAQQIQQAAGSFATYLNGTERLDSIGNDVMTVYFSNLGGRPKKIFLKKFKDFKGRPVQLLGDTADMFSYGIVTGNNAIQSGKLFYETTGAAKGPAGSIAYTVKDSSGRAITHTYTLGKDSYLFNCKIDMQGAERLVTGNTLSLAHKVMVKRQDNDISFERQSSRLAYVEDGSYGTLNAASSDNDDKLEKPVEWVAFKQRFFNTTLLSAAPMREVAINCVQQPDSSSNLFIASSDMKIPVTPGKSIDLQFYTGPNDYKILAATGHSMRNMVQLHSSPFGFVKWINRWLILPVFDFLRGVIPSVGLAIALLTLFIRLLIAPLTYSSYLSGAKMKALRPELDTLKAKFKDDQQGYAVEQMKLFRTAGVSPLGGCIPALLQIPIFFALYALFTAHIGVRGESFLWATDLSKYDEFIKFGVNIPLLGGHLSLFTITASITSFLISWYSMSMTPDQANPVLKYLPYIFPFVLLFIFNNLPSALTWYYTVSNLVTLGLQFVIQKYIINHDKILAKLEENKKKVKEKPKWQQRMEQMQETQRKMQEMKQKNKGK